MSAEDGRASWHLLGPREAVFKLQHRSVYTADDLLTLKCAVLQGTGISVLPDYLCSEELRCGELVPVLHGWAPPGDRARGFSFEAWHGSGRATPHRFARGQRRRRSDQNLDSSMSSPTRRR
jgi:DNA-binding transcriptional LysR family regulator